MTNTNNMKKNKFLKRSLRDKSSVEQLTPYKRSAVWGRSLQRNVGMVAVILMVLSLLVTACSKPEKKELAGTWCWGATTGGFGGWCYTPVSEGFEAELVFKGGTFTFYKDGKKITSGAYSINYDLDVSQNTNKSGKDEPFYSWFRFKIPEAQVKKISDATYGKITLASSNPSGLAATLGYDEEVGQVFSLCDDMCDGFCYTFVKKDAGR